MEIVTLVAPGSVHMAYQAGPSQCAPVSKIKQKEQGFIIQNPHRTAVKSQVPNILFSM